MTRLELTADLAGERADQFLARTVPGLTRSGAQRLLEEGAVLHGAWRCDPGPCIPCDCMRMPMLAFYGLAIEEH